jgi:hypothetical protein
MRADAKATPSILQHHSKLIKLAPDLVPTDAAVHQKSVSTVD